VITITLDGSTQKTRRFLTNVDPKKLYASLEAEAARGVEALRSATPVDSGLTAKSWSYEITVANGVTTISWINAHSENGVNVAVILQYGHGTGTGGYVAGRDYINPAMKPVFDEIADIVWKKVTSA
jgi:hypothetical protein